MKQNSTSSDIRAGSSQPELFTADGHLTDLAFKLLIDEQLDSLQSLEVSEHLSFCDRCLERYTEILCSDAPVDLDTGQELPEVVHLMEPLPCTTRSCKQFRTKQGSSTLKRRLLWLLQPPLPLFSGAAAFCRTKISQRG